ncbi:MAG: hypothetical protein IJ551_00765 [Prevotella sp.]|nr:hypothetical protein [Prevotella sp.]
MKKPYRLLPNLLPIVLVCTALASCTIIDNDLRDLPDIPGYKEIVHEETDEYTADYQYQPWTKIVDETFENYISHMDNASYVLYLYDYIPKDLLPEVDEVLAAKPSEKLQWGLSHKVLSVKHEGSYYVVDLGSAQLDEVFKHFEYSQEAEYELNLDGLVEAVSDTTRSFAWTRIGEGNSATRAEDDPNDPKYYYVSDSKQLSFDVINIIEKVLTAKKLHEPWMISLVGTEFLTRNLTGIDGTVHSVKASATTSGGSGEVYINGLIQLIGKIKPILKTKNYINLDEDKVDIWCESGAELELVLNLAAKLGFDLDIWSLAELPQPAPILIGAPIGLPLWFEVVFGLKWTTEFEGSLAYTWKKTFSTTLGFRNGVGGKNGPYCTTNNPNATLKSNDSWTEEYSNSISLTTGLYFSIAPTLTFGIPNNGVPAQLKQQAEEMLEQLGLKEPKLYLQYKPSIGGEISIKKSWEKESASSYTSGDLLLHIGVPVKFTDLSLVFQLTKHLSFDWNIGNAIAEAISKNTKYDLSKPFEIWGKDYRFYPSVDNLSIVCTNPTMSSETPKFELSFDINDLGTQVSDIRTAKPILRIYQDGVSGSSPLKTFDDFGYLTKADKGKHYERTLNSSSIKRDVTYRAEIEFVKPNMYGGHDRLYSKSQSFSSQSPSACIGGDTITYQAGHFKQINPSKTNGIGTARYYDWKFRTAVQMIGYKDIDELGFYVGKKKYRIDGKPASPSAFVIWNLNKQRKARSFSIRPYVKVGELEYLWSKPYDMELDYTKRWHWNDPNFGGDRAYKGSPYGEFYVFGYDHEESLKSNTDLKLKDTFKSRQQNASQMEEDDSTPVYEIELDDDAFDD